MANNFDEFVKEIFDEFNSKGTEVTQVSSTCLSEVAYNEAREELTVTFVQNGASYTYSGVPKHVYQELIDASSVGEEYYFSIRESGYGVFYQRLN
jgi:hypothetical protein